MIAISLTALAACSRSDYADGITAFSAAVTKADTAEQALITTDQQITLDQSIAQVRKGRLDFEPPDFVKCRAVPGPYRAGDCAVKFGGKAAPVTAGPSSMTSLVKYAALLSSVVADKTCATLQSDAKDLATAIGDIATSARNRSLAAPASALATIVSTLGCQAIESMQLKILLVATASANPIIKQLLPVIADKDTRLQADAVLVAVQQLSATTVRYNASKSAADLKQIVALTQAIEQAQLAPPGPVILKLAELHQNLTDDLAAPTISLKRVQNDARALIAAAGSVEDAAITLAKPAAN